MSMYDLRRRLAGQKGKDHRQRSAGASKRTGTATGTATADAQGGRVQVMLDGSTQAVSVACPSDVRKGERVSVIWSAGTVQALALNTTARGIAEAKKEAEEAKQQVSAAQSVAAAAQQQAQAAQEAAEAAQAAAARGGDNAHVWQGKNGWLHVSTQEKPADGLTDNGRNIVMWGAGVAVRNASRSLLYMGGNESTDGGYIIMNARDGSRRLAVTQAGVSLYRAGSSAPVAVFGEAVTVGPSGGNQVTIDSDSVDIVKDGRQVASFAGNSLTLGDTSSQIQMCGSGFVSMAGQQLIIRSPKGVVMKATRYHDDDSGVAVITGPVGQELLVKVPTLSINAAHFNVESPSPFRRALKAAPDYLEVPAFSPGSTHLGRLRSLGAHMAAGHIAMGGFSITPYNDIWQNAGFSIPGFNIAGKAPKWALFISNSFFGFLGSDGLVWLTAVNLIRANTEAGVRFIAMVD